MLGTLQVPTQLIEEGLVPERASEPFELKFPQAVRERPPLGQNYLLTAVNLKIIYRLRLKIGQSETNPGPLNYSLLLFRGLEVVAIFDLVFQMRLVPGTEGKEWIGQTTVFADLTNPIDYTLGQTLSWRVTGIVPGVVGGPQPTPAQVVREEQSLITQAEILQQLISTEAQAGEIGEATLRELEEVVRAIEASE